MIKVDLTWDETDHDRLKVTMQPSIGKKTKKGKDEIKEEDFKAYLASSSDEDGGFSICLRQLLAINIFSFGHLSFYGYFFVNNFWLYSQYS